MIQQDNLTALPIPHNPDAENTVIGSLIIAGDCLFEVNFLVPDDFYIPVNQYIFQAILNCNGGIDQVTIAHELGKLGKLDEIGGIRKLDEIKQSVFTSVLVKECGTIVKDLSMARKAITLGHNIQAVGYHETDRTKLISKIEKMFLQLQENMAVPRLITPIELAEKARDRYNELSQGKKLGLLTGFKDIDYNTGGLYPGEYWIVGARPSIGKCVAKGTKVLNARTGQLVNIEKIKSGDEVLSIGNDFKIKKCMVKSLINNGIQATVKVTTKSGKEVMVTKEHPFLTGKGWKEIQYLTPKDMIATPRELKLTNSHQYGFHWDKYRVRLLAYLLAEGGLHGGGIIFTTANQNVIKDFNLCLNKCFPDYETVPVTKYDYRVVKQNRCSGRPNFVKEWLRELDCLVLSKYKIIPDVIFSLPISLVKEFLSIFLNCDGSVGKHDGFIEVTLASELLIKQISHLFLRFGILNTVAYKQSKCNGKLFHAWRCRITNPQSLKMFWEVIGIAKTNHQSIMTKSSGDIDLTPINVWDVVMDECKANGVTLTGLDGIRRNKSGHNAGINPHKYKRRLTRWHIDAYADILKSDELKKWSTSDIYWDEIKSIEPSGSQQVYDLEVDGEHNFVANNIFVHNTTFLMDIVRNITSKQKKNVLMVSLEQGWEEIIDREMAHATQKNPVEIRSGGWDEDLAELIAINVGEMSKSTLYFYDAGSLMSYESATTNSIFGVASHMKLAYGIDLIVLDYIGLIEDEVGRGGNDNERVSYISRRIKKMARNLQVPVLCACQLSRGVEHLADRRPKLSDLRSSGALEQDADLVGFLYRDDYYPDIAEQKRSQGENPDGKAEFTISKQRTGGKGMELQIPLVWDKFHRCYRDAYRGENYA